MVTMCQKCGDPGITVALIYCDKCQEVAEHRYCLDVIPKTFTEYVFWFCEDCKPIEPASYVEKACCKSSRQNSQAKVNIQPETQENISPKEKHISKSNVKKRKRRKGIPKSRMHSTTFKDTPGELTGDASDLSAPPIDALHSGNDELDQSFEEGEIGVSSSQTYEVKFFPECSTEMAKKNIDSTMLLVSTSQLSEQNACDAVRPIFVPIWRGNFSISVADFDVVDGLAAHLSTKASFQVHEEARLLPESLCLELLPRLRVWPNGFVGSGPKDEHIGLFIFPREERNEKQYDMLVDHMIENDLAMRVACENADLLVFTSMELPMTIWRFQAKYYLWGVFKGNATSSSSHARDQDSTCHSSNGNATFVNDDATEMVAENRDLQKALIIRSPHSPLSNCSSHGSG